MANRTTRTGAIWADGAPSPPTGTPPAADTTYANASLTADEIIAGFPHARVADSATVNEMLRRITTLTLLLEQYGILPYCAAVTYPSGAKVMGSDGMSYTSLSDTNLNHDPTTSPTYWEAEYTQSLGTSGYRKARGGFIEQWGTGYVDHTGDIGVVYESYASITFPTTFPNSCMMVLVTPGSGNTNDTLEHTYNSSSITTSGCRIYVCRILGGNSGGDYSYFNYRAIGY